MGKNKVILGVLILSLGFNVACGNKDASFSYNDLFNDDAVDYKIETKTFVISDDQNQISIEYPELVSEENSYETVNSLITDTIGAYLEYMHEYDLSDITMTAGYTIVFSNIKYLSVLFEGISYQNNILAPAPLNDQFAINIALDKVKLISLADITKINKKFFETFKVCWKTQSDEMLWQYIEECTFDSNKQTLNENIYNCYFNSEGIVVIFGVSNVLGDYVSVEIPFDEITHSR